MVQFSLPAFPCFAIRSRINHFLRFTFLSLLPSYFLLFVFSLHYAVVNLLVLFDRRGYCLNRQPSYNITFAFICQAIFKFFLFFYYYNIGARLKNVKTRRPKKRAARTRFRFFTSKTLRKRPSFYRKPFPRRLRLLRVRNNISLISARCRSGARR